MTSTAPSRQRRRGGNRQAAPRPAPQQTLEGAVDRYRREGYKVYRSGEVEVYVDGSCIDNGKPGARAGIGIYWGTGPRQSCSEPLPGVQRSGRAEIYVRVVTSGADAGLHPRYRAAPDVRA
jgi:hypothetical protein